MNSINELNWNELNHSYQPSDFSFESTDEVEYIDDLVDQKEAIEAIKRGLAIDSEGYNLYISGVVNHYMEAAIIKEIEKQAALKARTPVLGYIYHFANPAEPKVIWLEYKDSIELKSDLQELRSFLVEDLPQILMSDEVKEKQEALFEEFEKMSEKCFMDIAEKADLYHIVIKKTQGGLEFIPIADNQMPITKEDFMKLSENEQEAWVEKVSALQAYSKEKLQLLEEKEADYQKLCMEVGEEAVLREIGKLIKYLKEKYCQYNSLQCYFNKMAEELLDHLELFSAAYLREVNEEEKGLLAALKQEIESLANHYDINLMGQCEKIPIINDLMYPQVELTGKILLDIVNNTVYSSFMHISPGLCHLASGGYLILHMQNILERNNGWSQLKQILRSGKIAIENNEEMGIALARSLKPEPAQLKMKVILIGSQEIYNLLCAYDETFQKLFKVNVHMNETIQIEADEIKRLAGKIRHMLKEEGIKKVSTKALLRVIEYGHRQFEHPHKISSDIEWMMDFFREAQYDAGEQIEYKDVERCITRREGYERKMKERLDESLQDGTYLIDTTGERIGQINGLAVYSLGKLSFGRPIRITATTYRGKRGIIDIENEAKLSGAIHTKGIHIITGFLGNEFAQNQPLSLNCNICFEQSYMGVDGDSASSAELYAIISSLAEVPIAQNIAVTGSVNQFGEIQPVGSINEKIEGFYQICKQRGLSGNEGVLIPKKNVKELMLSADVVESVQKGLFHIYGITEIWEGVEIMMNEERQTIRKKVESKLKHFNE